MKSLEPLIWDSNIYLLFPILTAMSSKPCSVVQPKAQTNFILYGTIHSVSNAEPPLLPTDRRSRDSFSNDSMSKCRIEVNCTE